MVWSKIYKKSIIIKNQVKFQEDKLFEDMYFIYLLLTYVKKIVYLENYVGYIRNVQEDSLGKQINNIGEEDLINILSNTLCYKENPNFSWIASGSIRFCLMHISNILDDKDKINNILNYLYSFEKETNFKDTYLDIIYKIPNKLIMKKSFKLAITYFRITESFYKNQLLRKIYRNLTNN